MSPQKLKYLFFVSIPVLLYLISSLPISLNKSLSEFELDILFQIRGSRTVSQDIILVYLGDDDINSLQGWPITRDYYSYAIYALKESGVKVIGMDIIFSSLDDKYPMHDKTLADFMASSEIVCLPMIFSGIQPDTSDSGFMLGNNPQYSIDIINRNAASVGFSNFDEQPVIYSTPLRIKSGQDTIYALGLEMANMYYNRTLETNSDEFIKLKMDDQFVSVPVDDNGQILLNHFGNLDQVSSISFVELLQTFRTQPEKLDLTDKIALIVTTASGVAQIKATPLNSSIPASLIHMTVIDNILQQNWLKQIAPFTQLIIIIFIALLMLYLFNLKKRSIFISMMIALPLIICSMSILSFSYLYYIVPFVYSLLCYGSLLFIFNLLKTKMKHEKDLYRETMLRTQLEKKQDELEDARLRLEEIQEQIYDKKVFSENIKNELLEQNNTIDQLENELADLRSYTSNEKEPAGINSSEIICTPQSKMTEILDLASRVSADDIPVLILGETGTGKELIAREIHKNSPRKENSFIAVNCGALPESILESELFGHEKGSFTGAIASRKGRFEIADGGTIFLDEITETSPSFQTRLLRVLQEGSFERVGSNKLHQVNIRILAATNKNIQELIQKEIFRADLYYRLNGFIIQLPALRERKSDIPLLSGHFLKKHDFHSISGFSEQVMNLMQSYLWPGNVRELENMVRRAGILAQSENRSLIQAGDMPEEIAINTADKIVQTIHKPLEDQILELLRRLEFSRSAISQTATALGNRDRGTITEYLRGMCFEQLVNCNYDINLSAKILADTDDDKIITQVQGKIVNYLENLKKHSEETDPSKKTENISTSVYRGLPKKYHPYLEQVLENLSNLV